jgi:hypothetical protein
MNVTSPPTTVVTTWSDPQRLPRSFPETPPQAFPIQGTSLAFCSVVLTPQRIQSCSRSHSIPFLPVSLRTSPHSTWPIQPPDYRCSDRASYSLLEPQPFLNHPDHLLAQPARAVGLKGLNTFFRIVRSPEYPERLVVVLVPTRGTESPARSPLALEKRSQAPLFGAIQNQGRNPDSCAGVKLGAAETERRE